MSHISIKRLFAIFILGACLASPKIFGQELSLAEQVFQKYQELLQREDIQAVLPDVLIELKKPKNQPLITPATINRVLDDPDILKTLIPDVSEEFITLLKEDADIQTLLSDPDVQALLQDRRRLTNLRVYLK